MRELMCWFTSESICIRHIVIWQAQGVGIDGFVFGL